MIKINGYNGYTAFIVNGLERYHLKYLSICQDCGIVLNDNDDSILVPHIPVNFCQSCFNNWTVKVAHQKIDMNHENNAVKSFLQFCKENGVDETC